jgi:GTP-binding protein HflX
VSNHTLIICPYLSTQSLDETQRSLFEEEAYSLCQALNLNIFDTYTLTLKQINAATYISKGHLETITKTVSEHNIGLVYIDTHIKPGQQRDLEKKLNTKVIDRTGLILEIFADRAKTQEGRIQVDLAYKNYQKSRLVRAWTHLERQRGGGGFIGGPGEKQTELDRRALDVEIRRLEKQLEKIKSSRMLQRKAREREHFPIIALVGYTNAGKSTLFNKLTQSSVLSKDMVFATLDPTMRGLTLPGGQKAILSDTVGFIRNLPTELVAAFSATLEEVVEADIILHVHDINAEDKDTQAETVSQTLEDLGIPHDSDQIIHVYNKIDLLRQHDEFEANRLINLNKKDHRHVALSAVTDEGIDDLLGSLVQHLLIDHDDVRFDLPITDGRAISWLHRYGHVEDVQYSEDRAIMDVTIGKMALNKFIKIFEYYPLPETTQQ